MPGENVLGHPSSSSSSYPMKEKDIAHRITVEDVVMVVIDKFVYVEQHRNEIDNEKNVKT